ncbi:MAG: isochorismatase family cysteine hydrolase [Candidatus Wallbacteria bacterium]
MSKLKKIMIALAVVILIFIIAAYIIIMPFMAPTKGAKIAKYVNPQKALLVIDVQEDYTGATAKPPLPYKNSEKVISKINEIISTAESKKYEIIYIRQEFSGAGKIISNVFANGTAIKGAPGTEIDKRVKIVSKNIFPKSVGDAFSNPEFEKYLISNSVDELFLTGLDAEHCVHLTAKGALNRGYKVNVLTDALLLRNEGKWEGLLKLYQEEGLKLISGI